jgi:UDP-2-acetamido-2,6-beta-L-arabino-hexul-4-ose reductase
MNVLVTGSAGFIGSNFSVALACRADVKLYKIDIDSPAKALDEALAVADVVFHLAGINRPQNQEDYQSGNAGFTEELCNRLSALGRSPKIVLSSSIQAEQDNPYGASKLAAEGAIKEYVDKTRATGVVYRLKNVFGKWCRPNYNSVTATFCHNITHDLPIQISDPANVVDLTYIDDVVAAFLKELGTNSDAQEFRLAGPLFSHKISLGDLAALLKSFRAHRSTLFLPDFSNRFVRALYSTYLSYLEPADLKYTLESKTDNRGCLAEFVKSPSFGQIFISRTKPGITRGNHYHHTKTEKFLVVQGRAVIRLRNIRDNKLTEFAINGDVYSVVDIPPGFTHSIENTGPDELVTLFWASDIFDSNRPDTNPLPVLE